MKKILFIYPEMLMGGSTTSLISLLNNLKGNEYSIELQLFRNKGCLIKEIPSHVKLLSPAEKYVGKKGKIIKFFIFVFTGFFFKALFSSLSHKKLGLSKNVVSEFQVKYLCNKNEKQYDYVIGFLEGWSTKYAAFCTNAKVKYAWVHSSFSRISICPKEELLWIKMFEKIIFVAQACKKEYETMLPEAADKADVVYNILDDNIIINRSKNEVINDQLYNRFIDFKFFKIITVCRITINVKGLDRIVNCVKELKKKGLKFLWYIVGDGQEKDELQRLIFDNNIADCLVLTGGRLNPYPFIKAANIMCMPSRYEGKPMVITESMILGTPPVVTEYLSAHEQIDNKKDGLIVKNEDNSIIDAINFCIRNQHIVNDMKNSLKKRKYGNTKYVEEIERKLFTYGNND